MSGNGVQLHFDHPTKSVVSGCRVRHRGEFFRAHWPRDNYKNITRDMLIAAFPEATVGAYILSHE